MTTRASGYFDVKLSPCQPDGQADAAIGRLTIDKQFFGDLAGASRGQMLAAQGAIQGSAGYVAIEHVSGTLHGRSGTFILIHTGLMARGKPSLTITVVPDSGTGELAGLAGSMEIVIADRKHSYHFDYTLGEGV